MANYGLSVGRPRIQARTSSQDRPGQVRYTCSECQITYYEQDGAKPRCPLCEQRAITQQVRDSLHAITNANHQLQNEMEGLRAQVDTLTAMRIAMEALSLEDLIFIKSVFYRWQADRGSVMLKAMHGIPNGRGRRRAARPNGFVAIFRNSEAEEHQCNSVGGVALAGYLEEATGLVGQPKAMVIFARAVVQHLKATVDES